METLEDRRLLVGDVTTDLVGHWQLEETAIGQVVVDASPEGNDGAHVNIALPEGPNTNAARGLRSLSVDGVDDHVSIPADPSLDLSGAQFTQALWVFPQHTDDGFHGVLGYHDNGYAQRYPSIWIKQQNKIHTGFGDGTEYHSFSSGSVLTPFAWNHVVTTFDGNAYKLYVDGAEVFSTLNHAGKVPFPTQQLNIGRVDNHFDGFVDDVRIYKRALTQEDVTLLFTGTAGDVESPEASLVNVAYGATVDFTVQLTDDLAIDVATLDGNDLRITGPLGYDQLATFVSVDDNSNGTPRTAVYQVATPTSNGTYSIQLEPNQIADPSGNFAAADTLGTFEVSASGGEPNPTGLVGHWRLEESAIGQTVVDASGFGNDGTHVNITTPAGPDANAAIGSFSLRTDGVDDHVSVAPDASLDLSGAQFTQSVWIFPEHADTGFHGVLGYHDDGFAKRYPGIWVKQQDRLHVGFGDGTTYHSFSTGPVLIPSQWNHVTTTFDGNEYKVYVDGAEAFSTLALAGQVPFATQQLNIGRIDNQFEGLIDDVRIYKRVLDASEVGLLYNLGGAAPGTLALQSASFSVDEDASVISIPVIRTGGSDGTVTVNYATSNGTAASPGDYTSVSGTLTFVDGDTIETIDVPIINDGDVEQDETFQISLSLAGGGAALGSPDTATITIVDDEAPVLSLAIAAASIGEASGSAATTATVTRLGEDLSSPLVVNLSSGDTTEVTVPTTVTIPANQPSATFDLDAIDDGLADGTQTVSVTAAASGFVNGIDAVDVTDNETPTLSVVITAASVGESAGAAATTATVSRNDEDLTSPLLVTLSIDDTSEASVPATVTIPANQPSVTFDIDAVDDLLADGDQTVTITASSGTYVDGADTVDVTDDEVATLSVVIAAASVGESAGAAATTATVSRNDEDLTSPLLVTLGSDDTSEATVPATVTIPANQPSVTFDIDAVDDLLADGDQTVTITASAATYVGGADTVDVTDDEVPTLSVVIAAASVSESAGAAATTATVSRNDEDLTSPLLVTLGSDDTSEATVPATVTIPANQPSVTFDIDAVDDLLADGDQTVTITASAASYVDGTDTVDVTDDEVPTLSVVIVAASIGEGAGAAATTATVTRLAQDLSSPLLVTLTSDDTSEATVPATVTIPANQPSVTFDIDAVDDLLADGDQTVTITASAATFVDGTDTVDVTDDEVPTLSVVIAAASFGESAGAAATTATVSRNDEDLTSPLLVTLGSDDTSEATVPATVTIPANQPSVTFDIDAVDDLLADGDQTVTITASAATYVDGADTVDVTDDEVPTLSVVIAAASFGESAGAAATTATVSRNDEDLTSPLLVTLSSDDTSEATVPATVTIPANQPSVTFDIDAVDDLLADGDQTVTITASAASYVDGTDTVDVTDDEVPTLNVVIAAASVGEVAGAAATTATVTRQAQDLTSPLLVTLSSDDTSEATVPATVTIPANQPSVTFDIDAVDDLLADGDQTVTITASAATFVNGTDTVDVTDDEVPTLSVVIAAASVGEGAGAAATTATLSRNNEDLTSPLLVTLINDDISEATVPATVTIPANQPSATFDIDAVDDLLADGAQTVTITVSAPTYIDGTDTVDVTDDEVPTLSVAIVAASIGESAGAAATTATVSRNSEDLTSPLLVTLSSNDTSEATVPATVTIPANQPSVTFDIDAVDDLFADGDQAVTITASAASFVDGVDSVDVTDDEVRTLTLVITAASFSEDGGASITTATVSRNDESLTSALVVSLASDDPSEASVPTTVTIPADQASATFDIDAVDDLFADGTQTVTLTASAAAYVDGADTVDVTDDEVATLSVSITAASFSENAGTAATTATVSRNDEDLSSPLVVNLASNDLSELTVASTVTIPADQPSITFDIDAVDDLLADGTKTVTVTASAGGYLDGTNTVDVTDDEIPALSLVISADSFSEGAGTAAASATVSRNSEDLTSPLIVTLSSNDTSEADVPLTVTIPANQPSAVFEIDAVDDLLEDGTQTVAITASAGGFDAGVDTVDVTDDEVSALTLVIGAASVGESDGVAASTATVTRSGADLTSPLLVNLVSSDASEVTVVASVTIPANQPSATFDLDAVDDLFADGTQTVTITASAATYVDGVDTVDVTDDEVPTLSLVITADSFDEGAGVAATTATVTRNDEDLASPLLVNLVSSDTSEVTVVASVTIPANQPSAAFDLDAVDDLFADGTQTVTFTASAATYVDGVDTVDVTDDEVPTLSLVVTADSFGEAAGIAATTATVTRNDEDLASPLLVNLVSSDTSEVTVVASVTIPANQPSATFNLDAVDDLFADGTQTVTITASAATYVDGVDTVDVTDDEVPTLSLVITADSFDEAAGAAAATATVTRNDEDLTNPLLVNLLSNDTSEATVVASVTIPANQPSATFDLDAVDDLFADGTQTVTITASAATYVDGVDTVDVTDDEVPTLSLVITADSFGEAAGVAATTATVSRNTEDLTSPLIVNLVSSDTSEATVPVTVTIPVNQSSATFDINAVDDLADDGTVTVAVTGSSTGFVSGADTVDVTDDEDTEPDPTGLVGHWRLEETAIGQTVVDASGFGNDGVHVNIQAPEGPDANAAVGTQSLGTDGVDDHVSIASNASLDLSGGLFTQSVWIYPEHLDNGFHGILGYHQNGLVQRYPSIWIKQQNRIHAGFGDGTQYNSFSTGSVLNTFQWNHVVTTFDGNEYKLYVDGLEVFSTLNASGQTPFPTQQLDIGRVDNHFDGLIDEVRIYTRVLDASEVGLLYNLGNNSAPGTIALQSASFNVDEDAGTVSIPVERTGGSDGTVTVSYSTADVTASSPGDYTPVSGVLTFLAGETSKTIEVPIVDDGDSESDETFEIALSQETGGATLGIPKSALVTIVDDEVPMLSLTITADSFSEDAGVAATTATVTRSLDDITSSVLVTLTSDDPSEATPPPTVTIPANQPSVTFDIDAIDDLIVDGPMTVTITASATGYVSADDTVDVTDDESVEPDPTGLVGHWRLDETAIGQTVVDSSGSGNDGIHVSMLPPAGPTPSSAVGSHSLRTDGVNDFVSIPADPSLDLSGGLFTQSIWIFPEHSDTAFHGVLGSQANGFANRYPGIWVKDVDKIHAGFGDGTDFFSFSSGSVLQPFDWNHVVTTFDGIEYKLYVDGTEVFSTFSASGKTPAPTQQLEIGKIDGFYEGLIDDVRIYNRVLSGTEVSVLTDLGPPSPGTIQMANNSYSVNEADGTIDVEVVRVGGSEGTVTVDFTSVDGSAVEPFDYTATAGVVTFLEGETSKFITVSITDDTAGEGNESFSLSLDATGGGATLGFPRTRLITIVDDDAPAGSGTGLRAEYYDESDLTDLKFIRTDAVVDFDWFDGPPDPTMDADTFSVRWTGQVEPLFTETYAFHTTTDDGVRLWVDGQLIIDQWVNQPATTVSGTIDLVALNRYDIVMEYYEDTGDASAKLEWSSLSQGLSVIPQQQLYDGTQSGPTISFSAGLTNVDEDAGTAVVTVLRLGDTSGTSSVDYATSDGTALAGTDYTGVSGTLNFAVDETSQTITIPITDDTDLESNETINLSLTNPVGAILGTQDTSVTKILDNDPGNFTQETVVDNLNQPVSFRWAPNGNMYVAQKRGNILVFDSAGNLISTFIDISNEVNDAADRGLLDIELHPDFPTTPYVYLLYVYEDPNELAPSGNAGPDGSGNRVNRMIRVEANPATNHTTALGGTETVILGKNSTWANISNPDKDSTGDVTIPPSCAPNGTLNDCIPVDSRSHAAGTVKFSNDGTSLFVSVGDGTSFGIVDPRTVRVQDVNSLSGKLLKIDPVTGEGFTDNPFYDGDVASNASRVYSYGFRNPFRFAVHPTTGEPFIGDVGWTSWEEVNTGAGKNFGWPYYEGGSGVSLQTNGYKDLPEAQAFYISGQPVQEAIHARSHVDGASAVIMGDFYTGNTFPSVYQDALFFADVNEGSIDFITFDQQGDPEPVRTFANGIPGIVHMATGPDGNLYFTNIATGQIERFVPGGGSPPGGGGGGGPGGGSAGRTFVVVDSASDTTYTYESFLEEPSATPTHTGNGDATGVTTLDGSRFWTVDASGSVFVYDAGSVVGQWTADGIQSAGGIAISGSDLWIVDDLTDRVYHFANGATFTQGTQVATDTFDLESSNDTASGIASDGQFVWVVDSGQREVFKYTISGYFAGNWALDPANSDPQGVANDPSGFGTELWIVDATSDQVFEYADAANFVAGSATTNTAYPLNSANNAPRGLSTPLPPYLLGSFDDGPPSEPEAPARLRQDVNGDGNVTAVDALLIINHIDAEVTEAASADYQRDVNGDEAVSALDALQVINYMNRQRNQTANVDAAIAQLGVTDSDDEDDEVWIDLLASETEIRRAD